MTIFTYRIPLKLVMLEEWTLGYGGEDRERYAYLDLLATALTDHEKNLDNLIKRLTKVSEKLSSIAELESKEQYVIKQGTRHEPGILDDLLKAARDVLSE